MFPHTVGSVWFAGADCLVQCDHHAGAALPCPGGMCSWAPSNMGILDILSVLLPVQRFGRDGWSTPAVGTPYLQGQTATAHPPHVFQLYFNAE